MAEGIARGGTKGVAGIAIYPRVSIDDKGALTGRVLGRPKLSDGNRDKVVAALRTGDNRHAVSMATSIPCSTVKKHARALAYKPRQATPTTMAMVKGLAPSALTLNAHAAQN
jgi:hypothetical protein